VRRWLRLAARVCEKGPDDETATEQIFLHSILPAQLPQSATLKQKSRQGISAPRRLLKSTF
jgi:hypothetical protein